MLRPPPLKHSYHLLATKTLQRVCSRFHEPVQICMFPQTFETLEAEHRMCLFE